MEPIPEEAQYEAGVFELTAEGWMIVKRRAFTDRDAAVTWMKRNTNSQARKNPSRRVRGNVLETKDWINLDSILADYERKRKAGDPDFQDPEARIFKMNNRVRAAYTTLQGQYLAFIHYYTKLNGRPPAEADLQRYFGTAPPTVHQMILTLEGKGLISHIPGAARSIRVLLPKEQLPDLE